MNRDADNIAARFICRRENDTYLVLDPRDKPLGFFNCWSRQETFLNVLGESLYHLLGRFDVSLTPGDPAKILRVENRRGDDCGWRVCFYRTSGFVAAVVNGSEKPRYGFATSSPRSASPATAP